MKVHVLQHVDFEGLGSIATWLEARQADVSWTRLHCKDLLPALDGLDLIIVLGGPMSVHDESRYAGLAAEKLFLQQALQREIPVLGICLGAQLMAEALGAEIYANPAPEVGWYPLQMDDADPQLLPKDVPFTVLHWHGETFGLPEDARKLASSAACINQAFQWGRRAIGLQFHLEMTADSVEAIVQNSDDHKRAGKWVQSGAQILELGPRYYADCQSQMGKILDYLIAD